MHFKFYAFYLCGANTAEARCHRRLEEDDDDVGGGSEAAVTSTENRMTKTLLRSKYHLLVSAMPSHSTYTQLQNTQMILWQSVFCFILEQATWVEMPFLTCENKYKICGFNLTIVWLPLTHLRIVDVHAHRARTHFNSNSSEWMLSKLALCTPDLHQSSNINAYKQHCGDKEFSFAPEIVSAVLRRHNSVRI